jgi:replicative DNA helicase
MASKRGKQPSDPDVAIRDLVFSPARAAAAVMKYARDLQVAPKVTWGVPCLDERVIPFHPGDLITLIGRPGSAKTSLLIYLARREAQRIHEAGEEDSCVVYVTWEQSVPELEAMMQATSTMPLDDIVWGRADLDELMRRLQKRVDLPIWIVGMGLAGAGFGRAEMTPDVVFRAIEMLGDGTLHGADVTVRPTLMVFDYVQLIPSETKTRDNWERVYQAVNACKRLAIRVGCPVVIAAQAGREVDRYKDKMPRLGSGQMSSAIEQASDKVFGLARPITFPQKKEVVIGPTGRVYDVTEHLLVMRLLKQRNASPTGRFFMYFNPATFKLTEAHPRGPGF